MFPDNTWRLFDLIQTIVCIYMREVENHMHRNQSEWDRDFVTWGKVNKKYYCGATGIEKKDFIVGLKIDK